MGEWNIGDRVRIAGAWIRAGASAPAAGPFPARAIAPAMHMAKYPHAGKEGTITGIEPVEFGGLTINTPVITLDEGTVLRGYECWWQPV